MLKRVKILPTGSEIADGTVVDTNSPGIIELVIKEFPCCEVLRLPPVVDERESLKAALKAALSDQPDLLFTIGGTGGGRKYVPGLAPDFTAATLAELFAGKMEEIDIYGYNGHLWTKIVAASRGATLIVGLPGPYTEALAGAEAALKAAAAGGDYKEIALRVAEAVKKQYPQF
ncbi:MAG: molybdopterin-binding protein [Dethiobacteria bacterium]|jgi:molybdopterin biosynthesis enzyme|nr:molybdopterin-binding protein [Bacillota bacterium]